MADKSTILRGFNAHLFEFIDDVIRIFPENKNIVNAKIMLELVKKANPVTIIKAWQYFITERYSQQITSGNMNFFVEKDYSEDLSYMANAGDIMKNIDMIRDQMRSMSEENKQKSFKYVSNLCELSRLYTAMK